MKLLRRLHLFLGCFFAPLLLFFIASGWYQTVNPDRLKSVSEAETLTQKLRVVHTDQIYPTNHELRRPSSPKAFQWLVVAMSVAMLATTGLGIFLAFRMSRNVWPVVAALALGFLLPAAVLWMGQGR